MDDKADELIRRNRRPLLLAEAVRARTEALCRMAAERNAADRHAFPDQHTFDQLALVLDCLSASATCRSAICSTVSLRINRIESSRSCCMIAFASSACCWRSCPAVTPRWRLRAALWRAPDACWNPPGELWAVG
jgi:hypothetical protein